MLALCKKEFYEIIRDQRSIISALLYAVMGPLLIMIVFENMIEEERNQDSLSIHLYTAAASLKNQTTHMNQYLTFKQSQTTVVEQLDLTQWDQKDALVELKAQTLASGKEKLLISIYINPSNDALYRKGEKAVKLIQQYQRSQTFTEGFAHDLNLWQNPFDISVHKTHDVDPRGQHLLMTLLIFILLAPFFSSLNAANDSTAGERERGSMLAILTQPIDTLYIAASKWLGASIMGIIGTLITLALTAHITQSLPLYELGIKLHFDFHSLMLTGLILIPYACFVAALQMWVALFAKNYKEGQNYLMLLSFAPMILIFAKQFSVIKLQQNWLPLIGHETVIRQLLGGQGIDVWGALLPTLISLLITVALIYAVKRKLQSEAILSGI